MKMLTHLFLHYISLYHNHIIYYIDNEARAIESQCYVIAAAQVGQHNEKRESYGHSVGKCKIEKVGKRNIGLQILLCCYFS